MRIGMSWPGARGRRQWISMSLTGWILVGPILFSAYAMAWMLLAGILMFVYSGRGTTWAIREAARAVSRRN